MLTISKPLSAGQAQSYHAKEFTAKEQNYWSQRNVIQGEWQGRLAGQFGLAGAVSAEDFAKLSRGEHPQTGEQLVRQRAAYEYKDADGKTVKTMEHRAGWDATFSAPKSISLTALVGGDDNVRVAHRESVRVALEQLENYTQARIGSNHPPETTAKFIAAKFEHDTARPVDGYVAPQLHTHAVLFNVTERNNGQSRAIQPQSLFASQQFATAVYQSELTYRLRQFGYEIAVGRSGAPEIKGYTQEYLDASSPRSQQIRAYLERTGHTGKEAAEIAAHSTRDRKEIHSPGEVMAAHRKLAADFGHQAEAVVRAARERVQHRELPVNAVDRVRESLTFARDKNFEREAVVDERALIRDGLRRGMGEVTYAQVRGNLDARLATGEFQIVERSHSQPARQFTTAKIIEAEHEIVRRVREGQGQAEPVLARQQAVTLADQHPHLNRAQQSVIEDILSSPDRIQGIQGFAGAGKTTTLSVIRGAAEPQGYSVEGFAPTSRAARQLNEAGVEAGTLQGFLARSPNPTAPEQKHFYFVDESSLASTNQMREFLTRLGPHDRVLLIGDTRQHQGVEAGRPFEQLQEAGMRTAKLDEIVRQKDPALKSAVELLAKGQVSAAVESLQQQGRVKEIPGTEDRTVEKTSGESATYDPRRLTGVSVYREIDREFSVGDRIQFTAPDKSLGVANRDLAIIESIAPDGRISALLDSGRQIEFDPAEHRHFDHGYAVTSHSSQGLTAERVLVNADTGVHPDLLNSRFGYVSISRASHEATLFTDDISKLSPQLSADVSKTSALEVSQTPSIAQGIGMM
jgi:conjugative relaxase-like TrwC/TraI family protein